MPSRFASRCAVKALALALICPALALAKPPESFWRAIHLVETSGRHGPILGDNGSALGPLQIHRAYWSDSRVSGAYEQCAELAYARRVAEAYLRRYAPRAYAAGDWRTLARVHNGGPAGHRRSATLPYLRKVERAMQRVAQR